MIGRNRRTASAGARALSLPDDTNISVGEHGLYAWRGTLNLRENPTMALLFAKIVGGIIACLLVIVAGILLFGSVGTRELLLTLGIVAGVSALVALITAVAYLIYVAALGGTYSADYLMDKTGLLFRPAPKENRMAKDVAIGAAVVSALAGNFGVAAAGIAATNTEAASVFSSVRKVKGIRKHCCIKVSQLFLYNQVYVAPQDYDFVYHFICKHCPKAKCVEV